MKYTAIIAPAAALLVSCTTPPDYQGQVTLTIDETRHDYTTVRAQYDQQERGGRYSVYFLPNDPETSQPYLCYRTYSGNPVAELWLRHDKTGQAKGRDLPRYQCYVPGTLSDGRDTLGLKEPGSDKAQLKSETGQEQCQARVDRIDDHLVLTFDALLHEAKEGKNEDEKDTMRVKGVGVLELNR